MRIIWSVSGPGSTAITALITNWVELSAGIPPSTGVADSHAYKLSPAAFLSPESSGEEIGAGVTCIDTETFAPTGITSVLVTDDSISQFSAAAERPVAISNAAGTLPLFSMVNNSEEVCAGVTVTGPAGAMTSA